MTERIKRKSCWDIEEEVKHPSGVNEHNSWSGKKQISNIVDGRYHGFSAPGTTFITKSTDNSGRPAWESTDENPTALKSGGFVKRRHDAPAAKEVDRYFKTMSPAFDGMKQHNHNSSFEDDRIHLHRYPARGRSRSRGRASGRSRSRSLSRGREMERGRSRSRSRSRSNGNVRDQTSSRSPKEGYRQSYGWSDRNRGPDKLSQICRDFSGAGCRRGSQCRFLHPNPNNSCHKSGDHLDRAAENWRNRPDHSRLSKHDHGRDSEFEMQDRVSDSHHGKDEQITRKNRNSFPCKDFMRGSCRWADSCEFSHHDTSGNSFGKGSMVRSFSKDSMQESNQVGKSLCKFFVAGKCDRTNCRFSHDDQKPNSLEAMGTKVNDQCCLRDKSSWSGNAMRVSEAVRTVGWGDTSLENTGSTVGWGDTPVTNTSSTIGWDDISVTNISSAADTTTGISWSAESEKKFWGIHVWGEKSCGVKQSSPTNESGSHDRDIRPIESVGKENVVKKQEQLILFGSESQSRYEILKARQQQEFQEDTCVSVKTLQQNVPSDSHIQQQHHIIVENNPLNQFASGVVEGMEGPQNNVCALRFSEQKLNRNGETILLGHSSISNVTNRGQNMIYSMPSNEIIMDLNVSKAMIIDPQDQIPKVQTVINSPETLDSKVLQIFTMLDGDKEAQLTNPPAIIPDRQVTPVTENPTTFLAQRFVNEQAQTYQGGTVPNSNRIATSFSDTSVHAKDSQLKSATISINLFNPMDNGRDSNGCNYHFTPVTERNSQIHTKLSPPISVNHDTTIVKDPENEELKQEEISVKAEDKSHGEESREVINVPSKTQDDHGNVEERNINNKDEKVIRVFKNALIEFVKEILKPIWKEGRLSREVHKTVVKKVSDKVTNTIQVDHIPKTQDKTAHYLSCSKPKITKLVQAYLDRCRKIES